MYTGDSYLCFLAEGHSLCLPWTRWKRPAVLGRSLWSEDHCDVCDGEVFVIRCPWCLCCSVIWTTRLQCPVISTVCSILLCLFHTADTDKTKLSRLVRVYGVTWIGDKFRQFCPVSKYDVRPSFQFVTLQSQIYFGLRKTVLFVTTFIDQLHNRVCSSTNQIPFRRIYRLIQACGVRVGGCDLGINHTVLTVLLLLLWIIINY